MKFKGYLFIGLLTLLLANASNLAHLTNGQLLSLLPGGQATAQTAIYLAIAPNSAADLALVQDVLHEVSRKTAAHQWLVIDVLKQDNVENVFSNQPTRRSVQEIMGQLQQPTLSSDRALIQAFNRLENLATLNQGRKIFHGYIVTAGAQTPAALMAIRTACREFAQKNLANTHLYVLGLAADKRLQLADALTTMSDHVQFAGTSDSEWLQLVRQF